MRAFALLPLLAACGSGMPAGNADGTAISAVPADERIECRIGAAESFERFCSFELGESEAGRLLTIRKPDGGFRRLILTDDGRGVAAADGAERAEVTLLGDDRIEVAIAGDTFRLPATVRGR